MSFQQALAYAISQGRAFSCTHDYTFDTDETKDFLIDPANYVPPLMSEGNIAVGPLRLDTDGGPLHVELFSETTVSANGEELTSFNRNEKSTNVAGVKVFFGPTITDVGTPLSEEIVPATSLGAIESGMQGLSRMPALLDSSKRILVRITNENGAGVRVGFSFNWLEI